MVVTALLKGIEDPRLFVFNVATRLKKTCPPLSRWITKTGVGSAQIGRKNFKLTKEDKALQQIGVVGSSGRQIETTSRPPKILYFLNNSYPFTQSGYTARTHQLATELAKQMELHLLTRLGYPAVVGIPINTDKHADAGIEYRQLLPRFFPFSARRRLQAEIKAVISFAREHEVDLIQTTTPARNAVIVSHAARELEIPWIYEVRGEPQNTWLSKVPKGLRDQARLSTKYRTIESLERTAMGSADALIFLSEVSRRNYSSWLSEGQLSCVIPNSICRKDMHTQVLLSQDVRSGLGLVPDDIVVGTVTSVVEYEGLERLVDAAEFLPARFKFIVVGSGPAEEKLRAKIAASAQNDRFFLVGSKPHDTIDDWYRALDIFVLPRRDDEVCRTVTPLKPLRAMAVGIPVVASDLAALREVTGGFATYCNTHNPEEFAKAIVTAREDFREYDLMVHEWLDTRTWDKQASRLRELYSKLSSVERRTD